ncbi:MAG: hypothetical protein NTV43_08580 [Methylococcales bacterium]|nr:hypothetical protein [Methylococcales bacterium]
MAGHYEGYGVGLQCGVIGLGGFGAGVFQPYGLRVWRSNFLGDAVSHLFFLNPNKQQQFSLW